MLPYRRLLDIVTHSCRCKPRNRSTAVYSSRLDGPVNHFYVVDHNSVSILGSGAGVVWVTWSSMIAAFCSHSRSSYLDQPQLTQTAGIHPKVLHQHVIYAWRSSDILRYDNAVLNWTWSAKDKTTEIVSTSADYRYPGTAI